MLAPRGQGFQFLPARRKKRSLIKRSQNLRLQLIPKFHKHNNFKCMLFHYTCNTDTSASISPGLEESTPLIKFIDPQVSLHVVKWFKDYPNEADMKKDMVRTTLSILYHKNPHFQSIRFLKGFSMRSIPSRTFVISYIRRFCTSNVSAALFRSSIPSLACLIRLTNFFVRRPEQLYVSIFVSTTTCIYMNSC